MAPSLKASRERALQLQSAGTGHHHVEQHAAGAVAGFGQQEFAGGGIRGHAETAHDEHATQCIAERFVVVDHVDDGV